MLRNDLITLLSQHDNDPVLVDVGGLVIDVDQVTRERDSVVIKLDPEDLAGALDQLRRQPAGTE